MLMFSLCFSLHRRTLNFFQLSCRQRASDIEKIDFDLEQLIPVEIAGWSPNWLCSLTLCRVVLEGAGWQEETWLHSPGLLASKRGRTTRSH